MIGQNKNVVMYMAISLDGFIADINGDEDFISDSNWESFLDFAHEYKHIIFGKNAFEKIKSWEAKYIDSLSQFQIIVVSSDKNYKTGHVFAHHVLDIDSALSYCKSQGFNRLFIVGGQKLNSEFLKRGLIHDMYLSIQPVVIGTGISLFADDIKPTELHFEGSKQVRDLLILHYSVI